MNAKPYFTMESLATLTHLSPFSVNWYQRHSVFSTIPAAKAARRWWEVLATEAITSSASAVTLRPLPALSSNKRSVSRVGSASTLKSRESVTQSSQSYESVLVTGSTQQRARGSKTFRALLFCPQFKLLFELYKYVFEPQRSIAKEEIVTSWAGLSNMRTSRRKS